MARSSLARYRQKRDFNKTPEPAGTLGRNTGRRYLIQKHAATRLHYDFRLELDGVLKSWAVTRGPSLDPEVKRLAVEVEDHPIEYGSFEGIIPKGQYGGGTVMLWDEGSWEPVGDPHESLRKGKLEFRLHGKRLSGEWVLVRMKPRPEDKGRNNWLLIKHTDAIAHANDNDRLLEENLTSVASGRTMEEIAAAADKVWQSKPRHENKPRIRQPSNKKRSPPLPSFIPPQLATLTDTMPTGEDWAHEIKFDGYRMLSYIHDGKARMLSRNNKDWTVRFQMLADRLAYFPADTAILDGEVVVPAQNGDSSFKMLKDAISEGRGNQLQYYVFDLLYLNGKLLTGLPLAERKAKLEPLLKKKAFADRIFYSEHVQERDTAFLEKLCRMKLEGVVSKRLNAPYTSGRGKTWLKVKCHMRQEFAIGGFTLPTRGGPGVGALLLGYYEKGKFIYAGRVGTGFDNETSRELRKRLEALKQKTSPYAHVPADGRRGAHWVRPQLVCEVEFTEWTGDGRLRHPSYQGLREDKLAKEVKREEPISLASRPARRTAKPAAAKKTGIKKNSKDGEVAGLRISHPDRIIYPGTSITKLRLAEYYFSVAEHLLPHVANRPLSTIRCPEGSGEPCFFQRHIARGQSVHLHVARVKVKDRDEDYMMIKDVDGLITLIQWGVIELHPWGCLSDKPNAPDRIIFDLDPDPAAPWENVIKGVREVRKRMREFGLESFLKTTGGKGLHVTVPITRHYRWPAIKAFARAVALSMAEDSPDIYTANLSKKARVGKVFVDYLRNELTATAVAPFSARAREGAPVAAPLSWEELKSTLKPTQFTIETIGERLERKKDPWADFFKVRQKIAVSHLRALKIDPE